MGIEKREEYSIKKNYGCLKSEESRKSKEWR